jgi:hypothetical protein
MFCIQKFQEKQNTVASIGSCSREAQKLLEILDNTPVPSSDARGKYSNMYFPKSLVFKPGIIYAAQLRHLNRLKAQIKNFRVQPFRMFVNK